MDLLAMRTTILLAFFLFVPTGSAVPQGDFWEPTGGPAGGEITSIAIDVTGYLYAGASDGVYGSTDDGESWNKLLSNEVMSVAVHANGDLYAGVVDSGLFKTTDHGQSWILTPLNGQTIWSVKVGFRGEVYAGANDSLYLSTDQGLTWKRILKGSGSEVFSVTCQLTYSWGCSNPYRTDDFVYAGTYGKGVYRTRSAIMSGSPGWEVLNSGLSNLHIQSLAVHPGGAVVAGTDGGVFLSTNSGSSWSMISPAWGGVVHVVCVNQSGYIFAATSQGVYESTDLGASWSDRSSGLGVLDVGALVVDRLGWLYAGTWGGGVVKSTQSTQPGPGEFMMGEYNGDFFGTSMCDAGDVNGDGFADIRIGAPGNDAGGNEAGAAYIFFGGTGMDYEPDLVLRGAEQEEFGTAVAGLGDLNADG
ncbi:MAG: FG-GAP repeat protein [Bacteroidetes bacterium]|nr:FG-GAP repeat protein [Bacteroidota bacterium]